MEHRNQFTFYYSFYEAVLSLPKRQRGQMLMAICAYALHREEPELTGAEASLFKMIKPFLDAAWAKSMAAQKKEELRKLKKAASVHSRCRPSAHRMQSRCKIKIKIKSKIKSKIKFKSKIKSKNEYEIETDNDHRNDCFGGHGVRWWKRGAIFCIRRLTCARPGRTGPWCRGRSGSRSPRPRSL